jgi:hypothetical protein
MPELSVHLGLTDTVACWLCRSKSRIEHRRGLGRQGRPAWLGHTGLCLPQMNTVSG